VRRMFRANTLAAGAVSAGNEKPCMPVRSMVFEQPPPSVTRMNALEFQIRDNPSAEETDIILRGLIEYNESQAGPASRRNLAVFARRGDEIVAGLLGATHWNWLHIQYLWVSKELRHQGVGRRLVLEAEKEARARGCDHAHLDTFSFQARPFYERLGYSVFGQIEDYPAGHSRFFLQKRNLT